MVVGDRSSGNRIDEPSVQPRSCCCLSVDITVKNHSKQAIMAEQLEFDPAMFGMKSNHGMLRSTAPKSQGSGANAVSVSTESSTSFPAGGQDAGFQQGDGNNRGGQRGGRGGFSRGRGGNRGGRGRGGFNTGPRNNDGQPFKVSCLTRVLQYGQLKIRVY